MLGARLSALARLSRRAQQLPAVPSVSNAAVPAGSRNGLQSWRTMASDTAAELPPVSDPGALRALRSILANSWQPLGGNVVAEAEKAMRQTSDEVAKAALEKATAAAEAVETFGERLEMLRQELDELSGGKFGGENVAGLPEHVSKALLAALRRYTAYLESFRGDEEWLKKKVQEELGSLLLTVKQRCAGLEADWNQISLLGTSGLSGSYVEKRAV